MSFQLSPFYRNLIIAVVALVIAFVGYYSMYQPKHNELVADQSKLDSLKQNYADLKRVADQKPQYLALEQQIRARLSGVELTADNRSYIPSYLKQIEDLAKRDGLTVTAVVPQPLPTPAGGTAPVATPGPAGLSKIPGIANAASAAAGASGQAAQTSQTAAATGEAGPQGQPANGSPAPAAPGAAANAKPPASTTPTARQNAIAYVNQSFQQVPVNMELAGTFTQLQKFLRDLNKFPKLIGVSSVTLNPTSAGVAGVTPTLHITLPITAYRLTSGQPIAPPPAVPAPGSGG